LQNYCCRNLVDQGPLFGSPPARSGERTRCAHGGESFVMGLDRDPEITAQLVDLGQNAGRGWTYLP